jgi:hypothetical protein
MSREEQEAAGVTVDLVRLSVGIEDIEDILWIRPGSRHRRASTWAGAARYHEGMKSLRRLSTLVDLAYAAWRRLGGRRPLNAAYRQFLTARRRA